MYQMIEHESGWRMGSRNRSVDDFLNKLAEDHSFEVVSIMHIHAPKSDSSRSDYHEYQIVLKLDAEISNEIPHEAIRNAQRDGPSYESNW